jgi:hypothetical protein
VSRSDGNDLKVLVKLASEPSRLSWPVETFVHRSGFVVGLHGGEVKSNGAGGYRALMRCVAAGWAAEGAPAEYTLTQRGYRELERRRGNGGEP